MDNQLEKRYGLLTAICMVVGIVIGSGVFFKAEVVLTKTGGNMPLGILAWLVVGAIMIVCSYVFATMANRYDNVNSLNDFAEVTLGKRFAYLLGWFMIVIYTPAITSVLAWVSARYTCSLLGWDTIGGSCMTIAALYLCFIYALNALSPKLSGKFQVSTTVIKMIPLILMAVIGISSGLLNGNLLSEFSSSTTSSSGEGLMAAVVSVAFACEGWILATSINSELKDAKKNLPIALMVGAFIVATTYILYYIGINGAIGSQQLIGSGENGVRLAFITLFGQAAGTIVFVLIVVSCLGTLNGLMMACSRGMYSLASKNQGPLPELFKQVDSYTNMPTNSSTIGLALVAFWLFYFYGANLGGGWFGKFSFDSSELPIITLYGMYIPMFISFMLKSKDLNFFSRILMPTLALVGCGIMVYAAFDAYGVTTVCYYMVVYVVVMIVGNLFYKKQNN